MTLLERLAVVLQRYGLLPQHHSQDRRLRSSLEEPSLCLKAPPISVAPPSTLGTPAIPLDDALGRFKSLGFRVRHLGGDWSILVGSGYQSGRSTWMFSQAFVIRKHKGTAYFSVQDLCASEGKRTLALYPHLGEVVDAITAKIRH